VAGTVTLVTDPAEHERLARTGPRPPSWTRLRASRPGNRNRTLCRKGRAEQDGHGNLRRGCYPAPWMWKLKSVWPRVL
jgi:hypothetical protein